LNRKLTCEFSVGVRTRDLSGPESGDSCEFIQHLHVR
jgi:hypothetical protein